MKRILPFAIVAVLIAMAVVLSLSVGSGGGNEAQGSTAIIEPGVWEALEQAEEVEVYISLRRLDIPLNQQTTEMRQAHAANVQASLLSVLSSEEFDLTYQYPTIPSLVGHITKAGVILVAAHSDVTGIVIPGTGTRD